MALSRDIARVVESFRKCAEKDAHHRYLSWEHCYDYFGRDKADLDEDKACLHMAFYLASWGMYRGSSFLMQKDYLIHQEVVVKLLNERHLRKINADNFSAHIEEIVKLCRWIKDWYEDRRNVGIINGDEQRKSNNGMDAHFLIRHLSAKVVVALLPLNIERGIRNEDYYDRH